MSFEGNVIRMGEKRNASRILVGKPLGKTTCIWQDDIEKGLKGVGWEGTDWIHVAWYRSKWRAFVNTVLNLRVP